MHLRWLVIAALPLLVAATPVELTVHVASGTDGEPVSDAAWIDAAIETASVRHAGADVTYTDGDGDDTGIPAEVLTVDDRDALAELATGDTLHVFVVARIADKDTDGAWINGVTWRYAGNRRALRGRRYIVLARNDALDDTLAHELGHFFGLSHVTDRTNLMMAPGRDDGATLDAGQLATVRRRVAAWIKRQR